MSEQRMKKVGQSFGRAMGLPQEFTLDLPKVELVGNYQVYIENHRGIYQYQGQQMIINCSLGQLVVSGEDLVIRQVTLEELYIEGEIRGVAFNDRSPGKDGAST